MGAVAARVNGMVGLRYVEGRRDCWWLVKFALECNGIDVEDPVDHLVRVIQSGCPPEQLAPRSWLRVAGDELQRLDILLIGDGADTHAAVVGEDGWVLDMGKKSSRLRRLGTVLPFVRSCWRVPACL